MSMEKYLPLMEGDVLLFPWKEVDDILTNPEKIFWIELKVRCSIFLDTPWILDLGEG